VEWFPPFMSAWVGGALVGMPPPPPFRDAFFDRQTFFFALFPPFGSLGLPPSAAESFPLFSVKRKVLFDLKGSVFSDLPGGVYSYLKFYALPCRRPSPF